MQRQSSMITAATLRNAPQGQLGGTPRQRARAARDVADSFFLGMADMQAKDAGKRVPGSSRFMLLVVGLAVAVILSFSVFARDSREVDSWRDVRRQEYTQSPAIVPGKRHRKLERDPGPEQQQLSAASDGSTSQLGKADEDDAAGSGQGQNASGTQQQDEQEQEGQQEEQLPQQKEQEQEEGQQQQEPGEDSGAEESSGVKADGYENDDPARAGQPQGKPRKLSPYQKALQSCESLACLKEAARLKRYKGQFLFPHFLIIGWQKCATTSLFHYLKDHPSIDLPIEKEPEYFSYDCDYDPLGCPPATQKEYIEETLHLNRVLRHNVRTAMFEGSTHYAREGHRVTPQNRTFAASLYEVFPWVRLIASMREPISRYLSMLGHNLDKNTYTCLNKHDSLFECLELELPWNNYTTPVQAWLDAYPKEQLLLLQYESLTAPENMAEHLRAVKTFLGIDPNLPADQLGHSNTRADRLGHQPEGWPMQKWQYERLIEVVRPDVDSLAAILAKHGLGDAKEWVANWEKAWQANLDACDAKGNCSIH